MDGITHKFIHMLKSFNFINVGQHPLSYSLNFINIRQYLLSYSKTLPHMWATNNAQYMHTILIKWGWWQIKIKQPALMPC